MMQDSKLTGGIRSPARYVAAGIALCLLLASQNCGKNFQATVSNSSAQCLATEKASRLAEKSRAGDLYCDQAARYQCEKRIFRPGQIGSSVQVEVCRPEISDCVMARILTFDTAPAMAVAGADPAAFAPGGEYNREEISCYYVDSDLALIEAEGKDLSSALERVVSQCRTALVQGKVHQ